MWWFFLHSKELNGSSLQICILTFSFLMGKWENILKCLRGHVAQYTRSIQKTPNVGVKDKKINPSLSFKLNQFTKSIIVIVWFFICALTQSKKVYMKLDLIARLNYLTSLKDFLFLSFQRAQNKHMGAALHVFFFFFFVSFFSMKEPCQPNRLLLTEECIT